MSVEEDNTGHFSAINQGGDMEHVEQYIENVNPNSEPQQPVRRRESGRDLSGIDWSTVSQSFSDLVQTLNRFFEIERAALAICDDAKECLRVTHMYESSALKSGFTLTIPGKKSTMFHILKQGFPVADNYPDLFSGNIIEKKIMMTPDTKSVLTIPLRVDGCDLGVVNLASTSPDAFSLYLEGVSTEPVGQFEATLHELLINS